MQEPVPRGNIHLVDKDAPEMHEKVIGSLKQGGHPATPQSVNPHDESALEPMKRDFQNLIGSTVQENFGGTSNSINDRTTKGRIATLIDKARRRLKEAA